MGKVTKTEIFLLVLTLLFAALSAALFFTGRPQSEGYTVTAQRGDDSPRQPESCPLNINTATAGQLETLDGIGQVLAQRIVDYRNANGPFASVDDLLEVNGIGPGILEAIRPQITTEGLRDSFDLRDDEQLLVKGIKFNLENEGYQVLTAYDGATAVELARREPLDLIILDLMMPQLSGSEACMKIREFSDVPIIMLTARSEDADKLMGFACGADDYVTKPFNILELKARIKALLRRAGGPSRAGRSPALLTVGDLSLDTEQRVALRDGRTIDLTAKEYDLIELLMKNPRRVYSRESLMNLVWGYSYAGDYRTVDVHIRRLREKLEKKPAEPEYIMTKWGVGYYFAGENQPTV